MDDTDFLSGRRPVARCATRVADQPLVIVVGLGGVGSHAAHLLLRSGLRRLRLIDFDQVTLSSLNRHATATRLEVGTPKATALRTALLAICPDAQIEARVTLFCAADAVSLLGGSPSLVVDAIDDIKTKAELQVYCVRSGLRVLSALGAGGKADCGALLVAPLADVLGDPVASGVAKHLKEEAAAQEGGEWWEALEQRVECVYSSEKQRVGLLPMPEGVAAAELGTQPTFRVRVLPVLPPVPAAFGAALASRALDLLRGPKAFPPPPPLPPMTLNYQRKLHLKFEKEHVLGRSASAPEGWGSPAAWPISFDEVGVLVTVVFHGRCALSGLRLQDPSRPHFCLCLLDEQRPPSFANVLFTTVEAAALHRERGAGAIPPPLRWRIDAAFARALCGRSDSMYARARVHRS